MYLHELAADENGRSFAAVVNRKLGLGVVIDFDASLFPYFMEWKSMGAGDYVVGLEPSNSSVHGRGVIYGGFDFLVRLELQRPRARLARAARRPAHHRLAGQRTQVPDLHRHRRRGGD